MCDTVSRLNNCVANIDRNYSPAVLSLINMQMVWVYCEFVCLLCIVLLQGLIPEVLIKQLGSTIITTKYGKLRGPLVEFPKDAYMHFPPVEAYFGIQYASMRNNNLRFIPPSSPTERYIGIHSAWEAKPVCPQKYVRAKDLHKYLPDGSVEWITRMTSFTKDQAEDCLSLNLFVPTRESVTAKRPKDFKKWNETEKLPVMIFIHGESYEVGTGNAYDGSVLASYGGVIVITVNYRLGVLGFLSTGDSNAEGNYALWDLLAILFWVKQNIERFGGDAGRVTLFGHGHGAALVNFLLFTKSVTEMDALFHNVILQSGSAFSTWAKSIDPVRCAHLIARNVNCSHAVNNTKALVDCFRERSVDELVRSVPLTPKYYTCFAPSIGPGGIFPAGHTLESLIETRRSRFANTKIMFGLTRKEAYSYFKQDEIENGISESRKNQIMRTYVQNVYKYNRQKIFDILQHEYTQWDKPTDSHTRRDDVMELLSDGQYKAPLVRMAQEHAKTADTYLYSFGYSTQSEDYAEWSGGVHGDELPYIFGAPLVGGLSPFPAVYTPQEKELSKYMMRLWTNFAKTGDPNLPEWDNNDKEHASSSGFTGERWPKYNSSTQTYLHIGRKGSKVRDFYRGKEMALWLKLVPKLNHPDVNSSDASHELDNAENMSTFDDPTRLISKFHSIFPSPPPPPYTPPFTPPQSDPAYVTTEDDVDDHTRESVDITDKPKPDGLSNHRVTPTAAGPVVRKSDGGKRDDSSNNVPLSIVIAVGAGLLFLNILISAVTYFQRKRIAKLREANVQNMNHINPGDIQDNRNSNPYRGRGGTPESVNLMNTSETKQPPKVAAINHKTVSDTPPVYSAISKPVVPPQGPGGYTYSALSQKSSSPMHSQNQTTSFTNVNPSKGPPSESGGSQASSRGSDNLSRPPPHGLTTDRSPKGDPRTKHIVRGNPQVSSNNAITIV